MCFARQNLVYILKRNHDSCQLSSQFEFGKHPCIIHVLSTSSACTSTSLGSTKLHLNYRLPIFMIVLPVPCSILVYLTLSGCHIVYKYVSRDQSLVEYCQFLLDDIVVMAESWGTSDFRIIQSRYVTLYCDSLSLIYCDTLCITAVALQKL